MFYPVLYYLKYTYVCYNNDDDDIIIIKLDNVKYTANFAKSAVLFLSVICLFYAYIIVGLD